MTFTVGMKVHVDHVLDFYGPGTIKYIDGQTAGVVWTYPSGQSDLSEVALSRLRPVAQAVK